MPKVSSEAAGTLKPGDEDSTLMRSRKGGGTGCARIGGACRENGSWSPCVTGIEEPHTPSKEGTGLPLCEGVW